MQDYILLIDDNPNDSDITQILLTKWGIVNNVLVVHSIKDALTTLFTSSDMPMLILLDLGFPGELTGIDFLREIRNKTCCKSIPVIIFTGSDAEKDWLDAYTNGANGYIIKPVDFSTFIQTVINTGLKWKFTKL